MPIKRHFRTNPSKSRSPSRALKKLAALRANRACKPNMAKGKRKRRKLFGAALKAHTKRLNRLNRSRKKHKLYTAKGNKRRGGPFTFKQKRKAKPNPMARKRRKVRRSNPRRRRRFSFNPRRKRRVTHRRNPGRRRYRRNPMGLGGGTITQDKIKARWQRIHAKRAASHAKKAGGSNTQQGFAAAAAYKATQAGYGSALKRAKKKAGGKKAARTRKKNAAARKRAQKRAYNKRKRSLARGKRSTVTKGRRKGRKGHRKGRRKGRKGGLTKKQRRSRAAKKAWRTRRAKRLARKGGHRKGHRRVRRKRPLWRRYRGRTLKRARSSIKRARRGKMGRKARAYARRFRMRTNPGIRGVIGVVKDVAKMVLPVAGGYIAASKLSRLGPALPLSNGVADPLKAVALLVGANYLTNKVSVLGKYKTGVMIGFGLVAAKALVNRFLPSLNSLIGMGDYISIPGSMNDYIQTESMGDYVDVSSDYADVGALEELGNAGVMQEMGSLGSWNPKLLAGAIPTRGQAALIHHRANTMEVPAWAPSADEEWFQGVFANRKMRDAS